MNKIFKKIISTLLVLTMAFSVSICAFATGGKKYRKYVCLGDSNAAGFATTDYVISCVPTKDAYHTKVADELGAELSLYSWCGLRSCELRYLLDGGYELDASYAEISKEITAAVDIRKVALDAVRENALKDIKEADLITVQVGANDLFTAPFKIYNYKGQTEGADIDFANQFKAIDKLLGGNGKIGFVLYLMVYLAKSVGDYKENWDACIKKIREINPDADLVVISINNPFDCVVLKEDSEIQIGKMAALITESLNIYIKTKSPYALQYHFCDCTDIPLCEGVAANDPNFEANMMGPAHPDDDEHTIMARKILETIGADVSNPALYPSLKEDTSSFKAKIINKTIAKTVYAVSEVLGKFWK